MKKNRAQKDILYISISSFVLVVIWIGFNIYHAAVSSTIAADLQLEINPINPNFNQGTIQRLKRRTKIDPVYQLGSSSARAATPTPSPIPTISTTPAPTDEQEIPLTEIEL